MKTEPSDRDQKKKPKKGLPGRTGLWGLSVNSARCGLFLSLLIFWQYLLNSALGDFWVSSPRLVAAEFARMVITGNLWHHFSATFQAALLGLFIGGVSGLILPFLLRNSPLVTSILDPYLIAIYGVPKIAYAPLFMVWWGIGLASKAAISATMVFFLVFFNTYAGLKAYSPGLMKVGRIMGGKEKDLNRLIVLPSAMPYIFAGLKIALPYSIGGAIVGEFISSNRGLGFYVVSAAGVFDTTAVFTGLISIGLIVVAMNQVLNAIERRAFSWRPKGREVSV